MGLTVTFGVLPNIRGRLADEILSQQGLPLRSEGASVSKLSKRLHKVTSLTFSWLTGFLKYFLFPSNRHWTIVT